MPESSSCMPCAPQGGKGLDDDDDGGENVEEEMSHSYDKHILK